MKRDIGQEILNGIRELKRGQTGRVTYLPSVARSKPTRMRKPPHPGEILRDTVLGDGRLSVSEFARKLGVSRVALSRVVNGTAAVSADMALRLAAALGGSAESWLHLQVSHDLWHAARKRRPRVEPLGNVKPA